MFDNQYEQLRIEKSKNLASIGKSPYPHNITRGIPTTEFIKKYDYIQTQENKRDESKSEKVIGRIKFLRLMGKAAFLKIEDSHGLLQCYVSQNALGDWFVDVKKLIEVGDIVAVEGFPFVTKTGELSLNAKSLELVTKSIVPLPEKFHGLKDIELRYRRRYLDMIMNQEVKSNFIIRSKMIKEIRNFFDDKNFMEVETPMMHEIAGGANARPFVTHHNSLGVDRFLRIAPELHLKRLVVGGMESVYEINKNFRNEGMDHTHNPEFTSIEFYQAYSNYKDLMRLTEELFDHLRKKLEIEEIIEYNGKKVNLSTPFKEISFKNALIEIGEIDANILKDTKSIEEFLKSKKIDFKPGLSRAKLYEELFDNFVEKKLINPTYITEYPIEISPLSRRDDEDSSIAQRFELFVAGSELANGFNELNDPLDQYDRFLDQINIKNSGDDEAHAMDEDFVRALGYGMPPTAGEGIGIDRLVMLLTNSTSIRDVILFPAMKPVANEDTIEVE
ncbi:MAG: Lysyl-tRNA synthetase (class II) (EC [uncultured Campylobacterales bacterium]|uniref:Lysine--tRNA ligase n=1 Tax=uncultured Campylobacterales bacterium TaxID=352960 RepID=A0A6S6T8E1_9BACT|nr:MAG: Lysyl-tRNA synthetase (class II) (EC [uncultured Campylobacterales bacterium]